MTKRGSMHLARKRRIHDAANGLCEICKLPVPLSGPDVRYDHRLPLWMSHSDDDENIRPIHRACDAPKTKIDQATIAKVKRILARSEGTRRERRPIKSPGFDKRFTKGFDNKVRARKAKRRFPEATEASEARLGNSGTPND